MSQNSQRQILPRGRQAGVCLHITSLPGPYGIGEIGQGAFQFIAAMKEMQLGVWQFLPTGPTAYGDSPYQPLSTFAGNELLIDIRDLIAKGLLKKDEARELTALPCDYVDYGALIPIKSRLLLLAAGRFEERASPSLKAACDTFVENNNELWLKDYALYRILKTQHGERPWPEWAPKYAHRDPEAMSELEASAETRIADVKVVQFLFFEQWGHLRKYANDHGVRLFGDMPIYIALDSADAWAHPEMLRIDPDGRPDAVAGVPPDYFSEDGQLWGNPLYDWDVHARSNYRWWVERLSASVRLADMVRIDHFRGFEAYWSVPAESETAKTGRWEPGPGDAIFDAMKQALGSLPIVAEDLGVITPAVENMRDRYDIPGMVVLQFKVADKDFDLAQVAPNSVCYTGTHDNDTTVGWYDGDRDSIHIAMIRDAFSTDAKLAIAPLQDYLGLGSEARLNTPGTSSNNWRWRFQDGQLTNDVRGRVASLVEHSGRALQD